MKSYKTTIIKKYGTPVEVVKYEEGIPKDTIKTKALLGRGSRSNSEMENLENQKEGIFLNSIPIDSGDFVSNPMGENFVVTGTHSEYDGSSVLSVVTNLLKCSYKFTVKGNKRVADERGNIRTSFVEKFTGIPCSLEEVSNELRQYEPGIHPDTEYRIFTTSLDFTEDDQITLNYRNKEETFKVISMDYITFPNLLIAEVKRDVRK